DRIAVDWTKPAAGSRPAPGVAPRLGQPSMADSPPQRIHALLSATPGPERPAESLSWLRKELRPKHRSSNGSEPCPGDRGLRQAKHGCFARESGQGERGWLARHAAHPRERPARCAGPDRAAALTERKAILG